MGITLHALVETYSPANKYRGARWDELSRWELGKDYTASIAVHELARKGWPDDHSFPEHRMQGIDQGLCWLEGAELPLVMVSRIWWDSLQASLVPLLGSCPVRVLFWEM